MNAKGCHLLEASQLNHIYFKHIFIQYSYRNGMTFWEMGLSTLLPWEVDTKSYLLNLKL